MECQNSADEHSSNQKWLNYANEQCSTVHVKLLKSAHIFKLKIPRALAALRDNVSSKFVRMEFTSTVYSVAQTEFHHCIQALLASEALRTKDWPKTGWTVPRYRRRMYPNVTAIHTSALYVSPTELLTFQTISSVQSVENCLQYIPAWSDAIASIRILRCLFYFRSPNTVKGVCAMPHAYRTTYLRDHYQQWE